MGKKNGNKCLNLGFLSYKTIFFFSNNNEVSRERKIKNKIKKIKIMCENMKIKNKNLKCEK